MQEIVFDLSAVPLVFCILGFLALLVVVLAFIIDIANLFFRWRQKRWMARRFDERAIRYLRRLGR